MSIVSAVRVLLLQVGLLLTISAAHAGLQYHFDQTEDGFRYILVSGDFAFDDNLSTFASLARSNGVVAVTFNSPGGNPFTAMRLGRLIRSLGLNTIQFKRLECESACALAFLGGVRRYADPGAIGVHKSSFGGDASIGRDDAVRAIQQLTADVFSYMVEMGVDPALLQLSLRYDDDDIRYLSKSEMVQYRVVSSGQNSTSTSPSQSQQPSPPQPSTTVSPPSTSNSPSLAIPTARSGRVRHPKGSAPMKAEPSGKSTTLADLRNGTAVQILGNAARWYRVKSGNRVGYMHDTWVFVDQFESGLFSQRHVQIKSFDNLADAETYARSSSIPLAVYLATNGWFAITLRQTYPLETAKDLTKLMKERGSIPDDSYVTYGNTYARKVCCR